MYEFNTQSLNKNNEYRRRDWCKNVLVQIHRLPRDNQAVRAAHSCNSWWLGPLWSDSVIKLVSVLFGKCTTLVVTKFWPMETRLPCGDQWKAEKLGGFWRWPITRCFIKSYRAGLFIVHSINFRLNGEHWRAVQYCAILKARWKNILVPIKRKKLHEHQNHFGQTPKARWTNILNTEDYKGWQDTKHQGQADICAECRRQGWQSI